MKIKNKLMMTYGILVILAFLIVLGNLMIFETMDSDSSFVNYSGKMRATSYKIAQLSNVLINNNDQIIKDELEENIKYFEYLMLSLLNGDRDLGITKLTHGPTIEKMNHIEKLWETRYKLAYTSILNNQDVNCLRTINEEVSLYVDLINEMVTSYSKNAKLKVTRAKVVNVIITIITMGVAGFSFIFINNGIRKPIDLLMKNLKEASFVDKELAKTVESISKDEFSIMEGYFNELIYDSLTKVYNRRSGLAKLARMFTYDERRKVIISLCFIDINGLKQVNDVLGHKSGDELIVSAVDVIKNIIRDYDFVIRLGGDEFLIVFNGITAETAETIWDRIVAAYDKINQEENRPYLISISHGIVEYDNKQKSELDNLIKEADEKMYLEKRIIKEENKVNIIR